MLLQPSSSLASKRARSTRPALNWRNWTSKVVAAVSIYHSDSRKGTSFMEFAAEFEIVFRMRKTRTESFLESDLNRPAPPY